MKLARYNEILFSLLGTVLLLGSLAIIALALISMRNRGPAPGLQLPTAGASKVRQNLFFCPSETSPDGAYQYIPIGVVVADDSEKTPVIGSPLQVYYREPFGSCDLTRFGGATRIFNVIVRDLKAGSQALLLNVPGQVVSLALPTEKCASGEGPTPCGWLLWELRSKDTNGDGQINSEDALVAHVSTFAATSLIPLTPQDATLVSSAWVAKTGKWQFQIRTDSNSDSAFTVEDGAQLLEADAAHPATAEPFVSPGIASVLNEAVQ